MMLNLFHDVEPESMPVPADFEGELRRSCPQPRPAFQQELAVRLLTELEHRSTAAPAFSFVQSRANRKPSARLATVLIAVLILGVGAVFALGTIFQQFLQHDPGLMAVYEQGLGHEIGISQMIDGYTVTLEWAYADGNRLTLAYFIQGIPGIAYSNLHGSLYRLSLRETGSEIPLIQGMSTGVDEAGQVVGWGVPPGTVVTFDRSMDINTYDLSSVDVGDNDVLELLLEVRVHGITWQRRTELPLERMNEMYDGPDGTFAFNFSVPLVDERRVMDAPLIATDQDITVTLQQVTVSPSQVRVIVCFVPPDPARRWTAYPRLTTDEGDVPGGGGVDTFIDGSLTCNDFTYFASMVDYTGQWRLEITDLIGFGSGGGSDQQRIAGSWVFEYALP